MTTTEPPMPAEVGIEASMRTSMVEQARVEHILAGPRGPHIGAFFDFDGTVVAGYSASAFLNAYLRRLAADPAHLRRAAGTIGVSQVVRLMSTTSRAETRDRDMRALYELCLAVLAGREEEELGRLGEQVMAAKLAARLHCQVWRIIQAHQRMGHTIVLVSSATRYQMAALARELGIEHMLCTEMELDGAAFTGRLAGPLMRGPRKATATAAFAADRAIDLTRSYGYADTHDDLDFLRAVGEPCVINPTGAMAQAAAGARWPILPLGRRPPRPETLVRSLLAWGSLAPTLLAAAGLGLPAGSGGLTAGLELSLASRAFLRAAGVRLRIEGGQHLRTQRPAVFISNHQSPLDATLVTQLPISGFTIVVKDELRRIPGLSRVTNLLYVERTSPQAAQQLLDEALGRLGGGTSVVIFPEGSRSLTPTPGPFRKGAFFIARKAGVPVIPIIIHNSGQLMGRSRKTVTSGEVRITVAPPIDVSTWKIRQFDDRIAEVRDLYLSTLAGWG
ncbi:HAD-IB family hydrolase [Spirillospora sp. NPDC048911]|uniref:HAD-IB family hydrolase n=1 Tax=Spirillospora sp. NPDC048911 TaxID=3364527 RepID=UPI0037105940